MKPESISIGTTVRVREHHRIAERRGMVGSIVFLGSQAAPFVR